MMNRCFPLTTKFSLIALILILVASCGPKNYYLIEAERQNSLGDKKAVVTYALSALDQNPGESKARELIEANYQIVLVSIVKEIEATPISAGKIEYVGKRCEELKDLQDDLAKHGFIKKHTYDSERLKNDFIAKATTGLDKQIASFLYAGKYDMALESISAILERQQEGKPLNKTGKKAIAIYQEACVSNKNVKALLAFASDHKNHVTSVSKQFLIKCASEKCGANKREGLDAYRSLVKIWPNDVELKERINSLEAQLYFVVAVVYPQNNTDEIIFENLNEFLSRLKEKTDCDDKLVRVIVEHEELEDLNDKEKPYDYIYNAKSSIKANHDNFRYLLALKITKSKISEKNPRRNKRQLSLSLMQVWADMRLNMEYGSALRYFEWDEVEIESVGRISGKAFIYDLKTKKIVRKKRIQIQVEDKAHWAENVMACGTMARRPATVMPQNVYYLTLQKQSVKSEKELISDMSDKLTDDLKEMIHGLI